MKAKPDVCIQYNSYFFENLVLLIYRAIRAKVALAIIIQDLHIDLSVGVFSKRGLRSISQRLAFWLARTFDLIVPISASIVDDFRLDSSKCIIFQGGITKFANDLMLGERPVSQAIGVFAGALESYNGVDLLVQQWLGQKIGYPLHIFGRGRLAEFVSSAATESSHIVYHGFLDEQSVLGWQQVARWNFCFRYSIGLNQDYFFPSKLFNVACAPGALVVNNFNSLPEGIKNHSCVVADDMSNLSLQMRESLTSVGVLEARERRNYVLSNHSWAACIDQMFRFLSSRVNA
ncbi:hypothetical protein [Variovorax sp. dw_954]|uniref:hypothetical protein n=1 Tax=Variovorax sp. dw_954 TaxID=2720078 RepID=UPI001BD1E51E|nr:hypothetical protein [Variovorax sp. dw_954]